MTKSRGKSWICLCQTANPVALNGMNHRANAQVTAAVLITTGRCLILFLVSHPSAHLPSETLRHTTKLYFALSLQSFALRAGHVYARAAKLIQPKVYGLHKAIASNPFPLHSGTLLQCTFVEHIVSFIAQTLNLKASCGVY